MVEEELRSFCASGAQAIIERDRKIRDEATVVLTLLGDHELGWGGCFSSPGRARWHRHRAGVLPPVSRMS